MVMQDTFASGVEPGGLYSSQEIKILICYMLLGAGEPMRREPVLDIIAGGGMANFFDTAAALDELVRQGHLREEDGLLSLTDSGRQVADALSGHIPYTLRDRSVKAALQLLARIRRERENTVRVEKRERGCVVTCDVQDAGSPLLSVSLRVADERQAALIKENFLNDPALLYQSILASLTGDAGLKRAGTQIVIKLQ